MLVRPEKHRPFVPFSRTRCFFLADRQCSAATVLRREFAMAASANDPSVARPLIWPQAAPRVSHRQPPSTQAALAAVFPYGYGTTSLPAFRLAVLHWP